jgi:uncharacterized membrane protein YfcA
VLETTLIAFVVIFIGTVVQASIGFGLAIIAAPFLFALAADYVPGPITLVALLLSAMMTLRHRQSISMRGLGAAIVGRIPGTIAGGFLLLLQHEAAEAMRANLSAFFMLSCLLSLAVQIPAGYMHWSHFFLSLPLLPAAVLGYWVAGHYAHRMPQHYIRTASLAICSLAGITATLGYWL